MASFLTKKYPTTKGLIRELLHGSPINFIPYKTHISELQSPAFLININTVQRNCATMENIAKKYNLNLRCHVKTHKTIEIAKLQTRNQIEKRIEVSTLAEAYYFANNNFNDILYGVILTESKFNELDIISKLQYPNIISVMVDNEITLKSMIEYKKYNSILKNNKWNIFIKINTGMNRCGINVTKNRSINNEKELINIINLIKNNEKYINFKGIYSYSGQTYTKNGIEYIKNIHKNEIENIKYTKSIFEDNGLYIDIISSGSTPACSIINNWDIINEIHPGNYVFYDFMQNEFNACNINDIAVSVLCRINGIYKERNEMTIDIGSIGLSLDKDQNIGYGIIMNHPNLKLSTLSQEIGKIESRNGSNIDFNEFKVNDCLRIIPNHSCLTACAFPYYYIINDDNIVIDVYNRCGGW